MDVARQQVQTGDELAEWLLNFAVGVIRLVDAFPKTATGKHVGKKHYHRENEQITFSLLIANC